jgi:hypothetical protein
MKRTRTILAASQRGTACISERPALTLIALTALWLCGVTWPTPLGGQKTCVPLGIGVPPNFRPPNWWNSMAPEYRTTLDDRSWQGAVSHSNGSTNAEHVDFRAIRRPDSLFFSWVVKVDPQLDYDPNDNQPADALWFGIEQAGGRPPIVFRLSLATAGSGEALTTYAVKVWKADATTGLTMTLGTPFFASGSTTPPPSWITTTTRVWMQSPTGESWAFQTTIPTNGTDLNLSDGLDIGTDFKMWYQFSVETPASLVPVPYTWPWDLVSTSPSFIMKPDGTGGPLLSRWADFTSSATPPAGTCVGELTIASHSNIGTTNSPPGNIQVSLPPDPLPVPANFGQLLPRNTFFVRPTNNTGGQIASGQITARFWIANWGSQPNDWENVPNPAVNLWKEIPSTPPGPSNSLPPGLAPVSNQIQLDWNMTVCEWFNFLPASTYTDASLIAWLTANGMSTACPKSGNTLLTERYQAKMHQCVLVELVSPPGSQPRTFLRKSYWNNLDVVQASTYTEDAAISVQGLRPKEGTGRKTVYLYVQTFNMPRRVRDRIVLADSDRHLEQSRVKQRADSTNVVDPVFGELRLDLAMPTLWVHVYRETAESLLIQGTKAPVLRPQSSFGYHVRHAGDLEGWRHSLNGARLVRLAPNFYKLTVPNDSFAIVTTTIEAIPLQPFAFSLHGGRNLPHGSFKNAFDQGFGITADLEHRLSGAFTIAALFGFHRFDSVTTSAHIDIYHISGSLEAFLSRGTVAPFIEAGGGSYMFHPGSTKPGAHAGAGVELELSPHVSLGASYRLHTVFTGGSRTTFSTIQGGGRVRF